MFFFSSRLQQFLKNHHNPNHPLYQQLKHGQDPKILLITCSDSRILPGQLLQSKPGEVFIIRNAGNIVPAMPDEGGENATVEYALTALDLDHIIICGHSHCGAMTGLLNPDAIQMMPTVQKWLQHGPDREQLLKTCKGKSKEETILNAVKANVLLQLDHIQSHPAYKALKEEKEVQLHGWVYDFESGTVLSYDKGSNDFDHLTDVESEIDSSFLLSYIGIMTCCISVILACFAFVFSTTPLMIVSCAMLAVGIGFFLMDNDTNDCQQEPYNPIAVN